MYSEVLDKLFADITSLNVDLVFYLDGAIQDTKFATWAKRQNMKYLSNLDIMDQIYDEIPLRDIVRKYGSLVYTNTMLSAIEASCKKFGQLYYAVDKECDFEIGQFAYGNPQVLAIFSNDTDFLIFPGNFRYFSTKDLNFSSLKTKEFDRKLFHDHLQLTNFQRAIFATIAGNDIVPVRDLQNFHVHFGFTNKKKIPAIANYIKLNFSNMKILSLVVNFVAKDIYGNGYEKFVHKITNSIKSYQVEKCEQIPENPTKIFLRQHHIFTYNVLNELPMNFSLVFVDLRQNDWPTYHELTVPMFQRQAGVALAHSKVTRVKIYTKLSHIKKYSKLVLPPTLPPFAIPELEHIFGDDSDLDGLRHDLLKWTIDQDKLKDFDLEKIPENYMIEILTIVYMKQKGIITDKEADLLLWTAKNVENGTISKALQAPPELNPRAFRIAFLYARLFANVSRSVEVCGLKKNYWVS